MSGDIGGLAGGIIGGAGSSALASRIAAAAPKYPGAPLPAAPPPEVLQARGLSKGATVPPPEPSAGLGQIPNRGQASTPPSFPGAPLPAAPSPELLQARGLTQGGAAPPPEASAGLGQIQTPRPAVTAAPPNSLPNPSPESSATIPRTLHGEGALSEVLSHLDNASLLKIAKSRGINVSQESLLKPGTANNLLIQKIVNNFSPGDLQEFGSRYLESSRFQHQFPAQMTPEAWNVIALQNFFPEIKIPLAQLRRAAIAAQGR